MVSAASPVAGQGAVTLKPASGPPGSTFTATATEVCSLLTVTWDDPPQRFEAKDASSLTAVVPTNSPIGTHKVATSCSGSTGGSQGATDCFGNCPSTTPAPPAAVAFQSIGSEVFLVTQPAPTTTVASTTTVPTPIPPTTIGPATTVTVDTAPPASVEVTTPVVPTSAVVPATTAAPQPNTVIDWADPVVDSTYLWAVLLIAAVVLLALVIANALRPLLAHRRRPDPPSRRQSPAPVPARSRTLSQVADDLLGASPATSLARAGPNAARIAQLCRSDTVATPLIATVFWEACVGDRRFPDMLHRAGASERALRDGQMLVVRHAGESRHDLLVLDPGFAHPQPRAARLTFLPRLDGSAGAVPSWRGRLIQKSGEPWASLDVGTVEHAVTEVAAAVDFGVIVAAPPRVVPTNCPSPAWVVSTSVDGAQVATVGAVVVTENGTVAVTTAFHAVKGAATVAVRGKPGRIVSVHEPTDSCLIAVDATAVDDVRRGRRGALGMSPRQNEPAAFDGAASGPKATTVTAWDLSILAVQDFLGSKVYTTPDTVPGDSGAALIDSADHIIGFAVYRSAFGEAIEYSAWVWADQVFGAHTVHPLGSEALAT